MPCSGVGFSISICTGPVAALALTFNSPVSAVTQRFPVKIVHCHNIPPEKHYPLFVKQVNVFVYVLKFNE